MSPLEQASRTYCRAMGIDPEEMVPMVASRPLPAWQAYLPGIRSAIEAIAVPTEEMERAGSDARSWTGGLDPREIAETSPAEVWNAMIGAVLDHK